MTRRFIVLATAFVLFVAFAAGAWFYQRQDAAERTAAAASFDQFVRPHSPVIGPMGAPVTIVEFFDPSCEACRAFYPFVKQIMTRFPDDVRLVLRYTPLHRGSDEAVRILETARRQDLFVPVIEALLKSQPVWAAHSGPDLSLAWQAAQAAGLDMARAEQDKALPEIDEIMRQDVLDGRALGVKGTPTFFVNGRALPSFGPKELFELVQAEVQRARETAR